MFMKNMENTLNNSLNVKQTENGALCYRTSTSALLDMNFAVASLRNKTDKQITDMFIKVFQEDKLYALKWLFYCRDIRAGLGERRIFRIIITYLAKNNTDILNELVILIPEYGRYDDMWGLLDTPAKDTVITVVANQLADDLENMDDKMPISLLAKWLPRANASSNTTRHYAKIIFHSLKLTEKSYRFLVSKLCKYLDVVEVKMSARKWDSIKYENVPSKANLIYSKAFLRNDTKRRSEYLDSLVKGETKINSSTLYPHEIYYRYKNNVDIDPALEEMWKALPNLVNGNDSTLVVCDGSGSMEWTKIGNTKVKPIDVSNALAIYFAERCNGEFKNKFITFSSSPQMVDLNNQKTFLDKIRYTRCFNECSNTNIEATFDLILKTAIENDMNQEDMPTNILVLSDMEFDACSNGANQKLFDVINNRFTQAGYKMPRLVFWNLDSRTNGIPVKENELGVALVSGFSINIIKMVMCNSLDPLECLLKMLNEERYSPIEQAVKLLI